MLVNWLVGEWVGGWAEFVGDGSFCCGESIELGVGQVIGRARG